VAWPNDSLTSFFDFSSSELKLLRSKAKKRLRTMKFPITRAGRKIAKHVSGPCEHLSLITIGIQL
jgi:hypothetical protein